MKVLVIGGTKFVGRTIVAECLDKGWDVTLLHRSPTDLFPSATHILGDRTTDAEKLKGDWDAVIDTSGYHHDHMAGPLAVLKDVPQYLFVSTISVYRGEAEDDLSEDGPVHPEVDASILEVNGETYGGLKVLCERMAREALGDRLTVVRPGLIVGPYDHTDRFTFWPYWKSRLPRIFSPDTDQPVQWIDARDLAAFCVGTLERRVMGTFNLCGDPLPWKSFIEQQVGSAEVVWKDPAELQALGVKPLVDLPMWVPLEDGGHSIARTLNARAKAEGLTLRPLGETSKDLMAWRDTVPEPLKVGLDQERIEAILGSVKV